MTRHLALGLAALAALGGAARGADRPNVVYIMADELGYFEPGFMGGRTIKTPNLDKLAAGGLVFRNLFAGSAVCAPTRCCLLTGRHYPRGDDVRRSPRARSGCPRCRARRR